MSWLFVPEDMPVKPSPLVGLHFLAAVKAFLALPAQKKLSVRTRSDYNWYQVPLARTFWEICQQRGVDYDGLLIEHLDTGWMIDYQETRQAGPEEINKELGLIKRTREEMGLPIAYKRLKQPKEWEGPGRALERDERELVVRICKTAADDKRAAVAALYIVLSLESGMGPGEVLNIKISDVGLSHMNQVGEAVPTCVWVAPRGAKRIMRQRQVVLFDDGEWAIRRLLKRAKEVCGCTSGSHYLIPRFDPRTQTYDPTKRCMGFRKAKERLLRIAKTHFRNYDCRHDAAARALQDKNCTLTAIKQHFGWVSDKMIRRYYHGNVTVSATVAAALSGRNSIERQKKQAEKEARKKPVQSAGDNTAIKEVATEIAKELLKALKQHA